MCINKNSPPENKVDFSAIITLNLVNFTIIYARPLSIKALVTINSNA